GVFLPLALLLGGARERRLTLALGLIAAEPLFFRGAPRPFLGIGARPLGLGARPRVGLGPQLRLLGPQRVYPLVHCLVRWREAHQPGDRGVLMPRVELAARGVELDLG